MCRAVRPPTAAPEVCKSHPFCSHTWVRLAPSKVLRLHFYHATHDFTDLDSRSTGRLSADLQGLAVNSGYPSVKTELSFFIPLAFSRAAVKNRPTEREEEKSDSFPRCGLAPFCLSGPRTERFCLVVSCEGAGKPAQRIMSSAVSLGKVNACQPEETSLLFDDDA